MDEIRKLALDHAVTLTPVSKDAPLDPNAVVAAAEAFRRFLTGEDDQPSSTGETASTGTIQPPPLPAPTLVLAGKVVIARPPATAASDEMLLGREVEGLARADQTPDDDTRTRLIRTGDE